MTPRGFAPRDCFAVNPDFNGVGIIRSATKRTSLLQSVSCLRCDQYAVGPMETNGIVIEEHEQGHETLFDLVVVKESINQVCCLRSGPIGCHDRPWSDFKKFSYGARLRLTGGPYFQGTNQWPALASARLRETGAFPDRMSAASLTTVAVPQPHCDRRGNGENVTLASGHR